MLSSKKLKPYIFSGGIFLFLAIVIVIVNASTPALALDVPTVSNLSTRSLPDTAASIINAFVGLVGVIALGIFVYGGYVWMTSGGIPQRIALAKRILLSAVIGFIIILTSWAIVNFIIEGATGDEGGPGGACTEGSVSGCYDCVGGSWVYDNTNVSCGFGDLFTVKWVDPKNGDANIPLCRIIQAGFSKNVNTATVTSANVTIQMSCANDNSQCLNVLGGNNLGTCSVAGNTRCSGNIAALLGVQWNYFDALSDIDSLPDAFEFIPPAEWEKNRTYRIEMTTAVASLSGTALSGTFVSTFSTGSTTDNTAPQVASIVPDGSAVPVCRMKPISAVFNEPMRASSLKDAATLSVADPDYASLEISKADGSISPDGLSFSSFIPDPLSVIYSPNKPYDKNTAYYPILRAGEDTDGNKKIEGAEDKNGNGQPDGIQDACLNFLDQTSGDGLFGSPFGDYGDSPVDADDSPVDYSFTTEDSDDLQCDPEILNIVPIPAYYDAPTEIITLTGKNFGNTGEVKLKDSISVNFANNLCLNNASVPPNTDTGKTCLAAWNDASITLIAPARTQASGTLDGTIDGPVQVNLGGIGVCDLGGTNKCLNGINSGNVCTSNNDCPAGLSNIMSVDIASPHIFSQSPSAGPKGQWITLNGTDFGDGNANDDPDDDDANDDDTIEGIVRFINIADRAQRAVANFPCGKFGWTNTQIIIELPVDAPFNATDVLEIQIERTDGRHSNFGKFTVNSDPLGPGICAISESCGESGTLFNVAGKRFGTAGGNIVFRNTSTAVETLAAKSPPDWSDESIQNVAVPAGLPDASYSIAARIAGPPISNSNSLPFNKPCPGLPCDLDTTMLGCQEDVDVCPALGPTYSCNTTTCRCVNNPLPKVIEQNSCTIGTQSPSPYRDQTDACLNAIIGARFNKDMDDATLIKTNMRFENCGSDSACSTPVNIDISPPVWLFDFIVWGGNGEEGIVLQSPAPLNADTYYRVILRANMAAGGYGLDGNGNGVPNGSPVDDYSWIFKTSSDSCEVNSISTSPVNMSVAVLSSKPINAIPQAENCNTLNAANYNWNWTQADATIATVTNIDSDSNTRVDPKQTVAGVKAGTTTVSANITTEPTIPAGTSNITVTNKLSCSDAGLTAVWKFDEQSGSVALDSGSSGANDGALVNNPTRLSSGCRFGKCLSFDGMADYVNVGNPASLSFDNKSFSAEAWVKINALTDDAVDEGIIADYGMGGGRWMLNKNRRPNGVFRFFLDPNGVWMDNDERIAVGSTIPATGKWYHVAGVYNHSTGDVKLYVNGSLENTASGAPISIGAVNNITIGDWFDLDGDRIGNGAAPINGLIDEVRVWNKALDISEIKSIYNQACMVLDKISCSDPNLAAVWKLDENSGIIANDSTANNNDGQLKFSPTWKSGADCKFITGSCLSFDGNNNYIDIPDDPIFNFGDGATDDPFTFEAWVKRSTTNSMDVIFSKYYTFNATDRSQYWFRINTDDTLDIYLVSAGDNRIGTKTNDPLLNDTNWHHVAATYDGNENANGLKIYVDGVAAPSTPNTTIGGPPGVYVAMSETAASFQIGRYTDSANNGENFSGSIDEPRIWNKALTQEEIVSAMNQSCLAGSAGKAVISCINDVAGLWNFDEGNGTLAADGSRNRNNGTLMSGPVWNMTGCQFGNCLNFDGANDYVKLPDIFLSTPKAMTVEGWFKTTTIAQSMLFSINSYSMYINRGGQPDGSLLPFFDNNSTGDPGWGDYNDGNWHYFAATTDGSTTSLYVNGEFINSRPENISQRLDGAAVGAIYDASANWYNGSIDELRVWNRVLSAAEIKSNYQKSMTACAEATLMCSDPQLTAVWKMDEGIGIIAGDSTKNNLDGALKNGLNNTGWKSGADCKFTNGKCLEFDGVDDIVEVDDNVSLDIASVFTLSAWVYVNGDTGDHQVIAGKWYDGESIAHSYYLELTPELHPEIGVNSAGCISPNAISANEWHFVAGTNDGATQKIYVDGVLKNSCNNGGSPNNTSAPLTIGRWTKSDDKNPFKGRIDEVMLWNKALTDNQIQSIYNSGNGQQCLAPQKGSACDLDLTAPMCQPNVGLCEGGDPDLRCSIKSCTCQDRFIVDPAPPNPSYTADSSGGTACRNTAISVNFNENIDASTIKTSTTTVKAINPPILSESFDALPAWTEVSSLYSPHWPVVNSGASTWSINTGFIIEASSGVNTANELFIRPTELPSITNYRVSFDAGTWGGGVNAFGFVWGFKDDKNYYQLLWEDPSDAYASGITSGGIFYPMPTRLRLQKMSNGIMTDLAIKDPFVAAVKQAVAFTIEVNGTNIVVSADGKSLISYNNSQAPAILPVKVGFYSYDSDGGVFYDNLVVTEYAATVTPGTVELYAFQPATGDLIADGDMERADTDVWKTYGTPAVLEKTTSSKHGGSKSLRVTTDDGVNREGVYTFAGVVNGGDKVRVRTWCNVPGGSMNIWVTNNIAKPWVDVNTVTEVSDPCSGSEWKELALDWWSTFNGGLYVAFISTPDDSNEFYVDDVSVTIERNLPVDISARVSGSQLTISPKQFLDANRNYTVNLAGDHLVSLWNFDESSGATVKDGRGSNNGTLVGPPLWKSGVDCKFGSCLEFDGTNDYIEIAGSAGLNYQDSNAFTVQSWIKWNGPKGGVLRQYIWDSGHAAEPGYIIILDEAGNARGTGIKASNETETARTKELPLPPVGVWTHVAGVFDKVNGKIKIYINGIFQDSRDWSPSANVLTTPPKIIGDYSGELGTSNYNFNGIIDDTRVWARALTNKEIADVAAGGAPKPGNGNVIFSTNGNPLENDYVWNGLTTGTEICKIGKAEIRFVKDSDPDPAIVMPVIYGGNDVFTCAGDSCLDDIQPAGPPGNQHEAFADIYAVNGGLLGGPIQYEWTPSVDAPFTLNATDFPVIEITDKPTNGQGSLTVQADQLDGGSAIIGTAKASANINVQLCENPWIGDQVSVPWTENTTNFSIWYCRDSGNMQDPTDDLPDLTVQEVTMSPGSPKPLKEYFYYDAVNTNDAIGIRVYANPGRLPLSDWLDQNANISGGQSGTFNGWQSVKAGRSLYVSAANDVGSGIYMNVYLISYSDKASSTLIGIYNQMISNWKFMVNGVSDQDIAKLQRDLKRIADLKTIASSLDNYKTANGTYPKLDAGTYLPGMSTSVWPSWQASFGNALQTSIPKDPINSLGNLIGYWKFDEGTGIAANDSSVKGNTGRLVNNPIWKSGADCKVGGCLEFIATSNDNGTYPNTPNPYVIINPISDFSTTEVTTAYWTKTSDSGDGIISYASSVASNDWLTYDSSNLAPHRDGGIATNVSVNDNDWHFVAVTWKSSNGELKVYKDGILASTKTLSTGTTITPGGSMVIGQDQDFVGGGFESSQSYSGIIDEVQIYNRALSGAEIALLAANGNADATGWNQDTNSFRCDAGTDFDSHIYQYKYNNASSYNLFAAMEYVGPDTGNTFRQNSAAPPPPFPQPATSYSCYNYAVKGLSCAGASDGLHFIISDACLADNGTTIGGDSFEIYCRNGIDRWCLSGEACPWSDVGIDSSDGTTCSRAGLNLMYPDLMGTASCDIWNGISNYNCDSNNQKY